MKSRGRRPRWQPGGRTLHGSDEWGYNVHHSYSTGHARGDWPFRLEKGACRWYGVVREDGEVKGVKGVVVGGWLLVGEEVGVECDWDGENPSVCPLAVVQGPRLGPEKGVGGRGRHGESQE